MKICTKCKKEKEDNDFSPDKKMKLGLKSNCKKCCNKYQKIKGFNRYEHRKEYQKYQQSKLRKTEDYKTFQINYSIKYRITINGKIAEIKSQIKKAKKETTKQRLSDQLKKLQNEIHTSNTSNK